MHQHSAHAHPVDMIPFHFDFEDRLRFFALAPALDNRRPLQRLGWWIAFVLAGRAPRAVRRGGQRGTIAG